MPSADSYRELVVARAGGACEYCRLVEFATGLTFHIEQVVPQSAGGETVISNLALSCPGCNLAKSDRTSGLLESGEVELLYNPRAYHPSLLGWHLHFSLDQKSGKIVPRTPTGVVTIRALKTNSEKRIFARKLQIEAGLIG